ncbi:MAG: hypothetical protein ACLP9L_02305 [Thermoguttaceae bacterium]
MADGEWIDTLIPGCGVRRVWCPYDDGERKAADSGLMTFSAAAAALGHSRGWLASRIEEGRIRTVDWMGRRWVDQDSVEGALRQLGRPDADSQRLEALIEAGQGGSWDAQRILERRQREADAAERAMLGGRTVSEIDRLYRDPTEGRPSTAAVPSVTEQLMRGGR